MRLRLVALGGAAATVGGVLLWRRRRRTALQPAVQLGLEDGATARFDASDPAALELLELAARLRHHLEIGG